MRWIVPAAAAALYIGLTFFGLPKAVEMALCLVLIGIVLGSARRGWI